MKSIPSLEGLGLTRLESLVYAYLVANPAMTGYGISKGIGKPTANVYRAVESLARKGAVTDDRASPPLFRATPPDELLDQLEREFMDRRAIASRALATLAVATDTDDDGIFALRTAEQVLGRARILLAAARRVVLVDTTPAELAILADAVDDARTRGVRGIVLVRGEPGAKHADTIADTATRRTGAAALRVVSDARDGMIATITPGGETASDAMWTRSPLFARSLHDAIANDAFYVLVERGLREGFSVDELEGAFERCRGIRALAGG